MNDPLEPQDDAATPLAEEEKDDLIPGWITLRPELNEAEQANIVQGSEWALARRRNALPTGMTTAPCVILFGANRLPQQTEIAHEARPPPHRWQPAVRFGADPGPTAPPA